MERNVPLDKLHEIREIEQLKYRYMRAVDTQDWELLASCFTEDAEVWYSGGKYRLLGRDKIINDFFRAAMVPSLVSSHIALHPEIALIDDVTAKGVWRFQDIVFFSERSSITKEFDIQGGEKLEGAGYYYDVYAKRQESWRIKSTGYVRLFETTMPKSGRPGEHLNIEPLRGVLKD